MFKLEVLELGFKLRLLYFRIYDFNYYVVLFFIYIVFYKLE